MLRDIEERLYEHCLQADITGLQDIGPLSMKDKFDRMSYKSSMRFNSEHETETLKYPQVIATFRGLKEICNCNV